MATFEQLQEQLRAWRAENDGVRTRLLAAREDIKRGRRRGNGELERLEARQRLLTAEGVALWDRFQPHLDPKQSLRRLSDRSPILLFPLRLETRFKTSEAGVPQLWVRVYPDDCLVDSFEPTLTEAEVKNAQAFWANIWRAGGVEAQERAAWRNLAASHGVGRAGWIIDQYQPLNPGDKPVRDDPSDVLLVVHSPLPLPAAVVTFWTAVWKAGPDEGAVQAARDALVTAIGPAAAKEVMDNPPFNLGDQPAEGWTRAATRVKVVALSLTQLADMPARRSSWSAAPRVELLPEHLVLLGYRGAAVELEAMTEYPIRTPLAVGPDPNAPPSDQLKPDGDSLQIPAELKWMFDFQAALEAGMAFRIDLSPLQASQGFDKLVVLGVRISDSAAAGQDAFTRLAEHHLLSRAGMSIVPQGTPTNNTEKGGSGFRYGDDPEAGFDAFYLKRPLYTVQSDPFARADGQWLAEALAMPHALAQRIPNAEGRDQADARAMHAALWPGTMGYMMRTMLHPVFGADDIDATWRFMTRHVLGRGGIPAVRVGAQPYGILPTAWFTRMDWFNVDPQSPNAPELDYLRRLHALLVKMDAEWAGQLAKVSHVGKPGADPHQVLLDVLGLHPASVEYYPLKAESAEQHFHALALLNHPLAIALLASLKAKPAAMALLREFGYRGEAEPEALTKLFSSLQPRLDGPLIDEPPLSEELGLAKVAAGANYIEWLLKAAATDLETLQEERGFDAGKRPRALLYLMLRHAMQLTYHLVGTRQKAASTKAVPADAFVEPKAVHVRGAAPASESRYAVLMDTLPGGLRIADYISRNLRLLDPELTAQVEALERLASASTARLERAFAEHLDCCNYRLDAWKQGLLQLQLEQMRSTGLRGKGREASGLYLGAFGWLEHVRPENKRLTPKQLEEEVAAQVNKPGDPPLMHDPTNGGLIHSPSINHATTAAVLRNGYMANDGRMAVDLGSRRVRLALDILEGMRNGQSLGALLGYHFERQLHDSSTISVRALTFALRRKFPLVANQIKATQDTSAAIETIAAMNVVDGVKLIRHVEQSSVKTYPYGLPDVPAPVPAELGPIVDSAVAYIADINDAVADLVLAEGVHQAVNGNYDRAAGTLDAFSKGNYPPQPEVIETPRTGTALVLRTAIHLLANPPAPPIATPLARAEPAVDHWLAARLPAPGMVGCNVRFTSRASNAPDALFISQADLGLAPIDVLYHLDTAADAGLRFLDDRILARLHAAADPKLDAPVEIAYTERVAGKVTWFELAALTTSLRALVMTSRPLDPADLLRGNDTRAAQLPAATLDKARLVAVREELRARLPHLATLATTVAGGTIDSAIAAFADEFARLALYRLPQTGTGFAYEWRAAFHAGLAADLKTLREDWAARLAECDAKLAAYDGTPGGDEAERILALQAAEILVSTSYLAPPPATSAAYRAQVGIKRDAFAAQLAALDAIAATRYATTDAFLQALKALDLSPYDTKGLGLAARDDEIARFRQQLIGAVRALEKDLNEQRFTAALDALLAGTPSVANVQKVAQSVFGEDFAMVPQFTLPQEPAAALSAAWEEWATGRLTKYLTDVAGREFPVDDWLHGVARVRDKMRHWENAVALCEAFGAAPPEPQPLQLPAVTGESWFAMEFPPPAEAGARGVPGDRLLYTAHFSETLDAARPICGLLVDEWTEVVPESEETTGVAFHYDRPNAEPPQVWLLALPALMTGTWSWEELLGAVNDALENAKRRAIEPAHVATTRYNWLLPATYSAYTFPEISISNYLLRNVDLYSKINIERGSNG